MMIYEVGFSLSNTPVERPVKAFYVEWKSGTKELQILALRVPVAYALASGCSTSRQRIYEGGSKSN